MSVNSKMTAIADAIRAKTGGTDALTLDGMAQAVAGIQAGGGDDLAKAIVERTVTEVSDASIETVGKYAFYQCSNLTSADLPACTSVGESAFYYCSKLTSADLPACTSVGESAFYRCSNLTSADLPACTSVGESAFYGCGNIEEVNLPVCANLGNSSFYNCPKLKTLVLPACQKINYGTFSNNRLFSTLDLHVCTSVDISAFNYASSFKNLILRSESLCAATTSSGFSGCFHFTGQVNSTYNPEGLKDGYIYVPDTLVEDYKAATNWSVWADNIKPLSEYVEVTA